MQADNAADVEHQHDEVTVTERNQATQTTQTTQATQTEGYVVPLVHVRMPEAMVNAAFWGALGGAALLGAVDPPLAVLIGAGVVVARHQGAKGPNGARAANGAKAAKAAKTRTATGASR